MSRTWAEATAARTIRATRNEGPAIKPEAQVTVCIFILISLYITNSLSTHKGHRAQVYCSTASLPFGATLRVIPCRAGEGASPLRSPCEQCRAFGAFRNSSGIHRPRQRGGGSEWNAKAEKSALSLRRSVGPATWTSRTPLGARAHPRAGADPNLNQRPLGQYPQRERRGAGGGRASGRHRAGARHFDRLRGNRDDDQVSRSRNRVGSGGSGLPHPRAKPRPRTLQDQDQDRDPEKNPEEVKVLRGNPHQVSLAF